ncbi:MAG: hypothetical protein R3F28_12160 [Candidatus Kapaibacterium sp.]
MSKNSRKKKPDFSQKTKDKIIRESGLLCNNPECGIIVSLGETEAKTGSIIGEIAHIEGAEPTAARYNEKQTDSERSSHNNAILLCANCHAKVDRQPELYPVDLLNSWKKQNLDYIASGQASRDRIIGKNFKESLRNSITTKKMISEENCRATLHMFVSSSETTEELLRQVVVPPDLIHSIDTAFQSISLSTSRVILLIGGMGTGKSMAIERLYQLQAELFLQSSDITIPIMLRGLSRSESIIEAVHKDLPTTGHAQIEQELILIDQLDEESLNTVSMRIAEARAISQNSNRVIVISLRSYDAMSEDIQRVIMPSLSEEDTLKLISCAANRTFDTHSRRSIPKVIWSLIDRPLFALLYGYWYQHSKGWPRPSTVRMITVLVNQSLQRITDPHPEVRRFLMELAIRLTNNGGQRVRVQEIVSGFELQDLLRTGIVQQKDDHLRFSLPILSRWFAAEAILSQEVSLTEVLRSPESIDLWKYALIFAISRGGLNRQQLLGDLTRLNPSLAAECISRVAVSNSVSDISQLEIRNKIEQLQECMICWAEGLGSLSSLLPPLNSDGSVDALLFKTGVKSELFSEGLMYLWDGNRLHQRNDVIEGISRTDSERATWYMHSARNIGDLWEWHTSLKVIWSQFEKLIKGRGFNRIVSGVLRNEEVWRHARWIVGHIWSNTNPVSIDEVIAEFSKRKWVDGHAPKEFLWSNRGKYYPLWFWKETLHLSSQITDPSGIYPKKKGSRPSWNDFSESGALHRIKVIFQNAINAYTEIISSILKSISSRMSLAVKLPVLVRVSVYRDTLTEESVRIAYGFLPQIGSDQNEVSVAIRGKYAGFAEEEKILNDHYHEFTRLAKQREGFYWDGRLTHYSTSIESSSVTPISDLVYEWISDDLKSIGWTNKSLRDEAF